jgi:hypothetical protein
VKTYSRIDEQSRRTVGFEIDNVYMSLSAVASVLSRIEGVTDVRRRRLFSEWEEVHLWFKYRGVDCVVWEPYGDSSRYWIGQKDSPEAIDMSAIETAFRFYHPPLHRRIIGDILTLQFLSRLWNRSKHADP